MKKGILGVMQNSAKTGARASHLKASVEVHPPSSSDLTHHCKGGFSGLPSFLAHLLAPDLIAVGAACGR